jgi:hypothetical protein
MSNRLSWSRTRVADLHVQTQHVRGGHVTKANYDVVKGHPVLAWRKSEYRLHMKGIFRFNKVK